ncbi:hypothetical protein BD309DRAFT_983890 [Dichomitus squalens]|nr:hypothetical protein BD309DRAFT_983890 [Dichomitus squalens]
MYEFRALVSSGFHGYSAPKFSEVPPRPKLRHNKASSVLSWAAPVDSPWTGVRGTLSNLQWTSIPTEVVLGDSRPGEACFCPLSPVSPEVSSAGCIKPSGLMHKFRAVDGNRKRTGWLPGISTATETKHGGIRISQENYPRRQAVGHRSTQYRRSASTDTFGLSKARSTIGVSELLAKERWNN